MKQITQSIILVFTCMFLLQANCQPERKPSTVIGKDSIDAKNALLRYYECEECTDGELEAVVKYGDNVVPSLSLTMQQGVSPVLKSAHEQYLRDTYRQLSEYAKTHPENVLKSTEAEYVAMYLERYDNQHRIRAIEALARIGTDLAKKELNSFAKEGKPNAAVADALKRAGI